MRRALLPLLLALWLAPAQAAYNVPVPTTLLTGTLQAPQFPALSGDCATTAGAFATLCSIPFTHLTGAATAAQVPALSALTGSVTVAQLPVIPTSQLGAATGGTSAAAGKPGEVISSDVLFSSPVSATSGTPLNITSVSLTAGDWDCWASGGAAPAAGTITQLIAYTITPTTAGVTINTLSSAYITGSFTASQVPAMGSVRLRENVSATTTIFLAGQLAFTTSTSGMWGHLECRRMR